MIELIGFVPDFSPTTPGAVTSCSNTIPSKTGMKGAPSAIEAQSGLAALAAECRGSAVLQNTTGTRRHFAGSQTRLYENTGVTAWADVSRGSAYAGSTESRWLFEQFGNIRLATNGVEKIQWADAGSFADVTAAPIARVVFATENFVFGLDCNHTATGDNADGWMCSAYQDYSSWTASVSTQATSGRLIGSNGPLTAGLALGPYAVAYKEENVFLGSYVGPPVVWQWERIPGDIGCVGPEAVCDIGGAHVFVGKDNIWLFNGTAPLPISEGIHDWFFSNISAASKDKTTLRFDRKNGNVWIFYPSGSSTTLNAAVVYNLARKRWGVANMSVEAVVYFRASGVTWDTMGSVGATWDTLPDIPWDSAFWTSGAESLAIFNTSHQLKSLSGSSSGGSISTWRAGDDSQLSMLRSSRLRFTVAPTSATGQPNCRMEAAGTGSAGSISTYSGGKFDHRQSGNFHDVDYTFVGPFDVSAVRLELIPQGQR